MARKLKVIDLDGAGKSWKGKIKAKTLGGLYLSNWVFKTPFDLQRVTVKGDVRIQNCRFKNSFSLTDATIEGDLRIDGRFATPSVPPPEAAAVALGVAEVVLLSSQIKGEADIRLEDAGDENSPVEPELRRALRARECTIGRRLNVSLPSDTLFDVIGSKCTTLDVSASERCRVEIDFSDFRALRLSSKRGRTLGKVLIRTSAIRLISITKGAQIDEIAIRNCTSDDVLSIEPEVKLNKLEIHDSKLAEFQLTGDTRLDPVDQTAKVPEETWGRIDAIVVRGCEIAGGLRLVGLKASKSIAFLDCHIGSAHLEFIKADRVKHEDALRFTGCHVTHSLSFSQVTATGRLSADRIVVNGTVDVLKTTINAGSGDAERPRDITSLSFRSSRIGGHTSLNECKFSGAADFDASQTKSFTLADSEIVGGVRLRQADIEGSFTVARTAWTNLACKCQPGAFISLEFAKVSGEVAFDSNAVPAPAQTSPKPGGDKNTGGAILAAGIFVGARIRLLDTAVDQDVNLEGAIVNGPVLLGRSDAILKVGGRLSFNGAEINGPFLLNRVHVDDVPGMPVDQSRDGQAVNDFAVANDDDVVTDFRHMIVRGDLRILDGNFKARQRGKELATGVSLRSVEIDGDLQIAARTTISGDLSLEDCLIKGGGNLGGATITGNLDMRSAVIQGEVFGDHPALNRKGPPSRGDAPQTAEPWPNVAGRILARNSRLRELIVFTGDVAQCVSRENAQGSRFDLSFSQIGSLRIWYPDDEKRDRKTRLFDCDGLEFKEIRVQTRTDKASSDELKRNATRIVGLLLKDIDYNRSVYLAIERWLRSSGFDVNADEVFEQTWTYRPSVRERTFKVWLPQLPFMPKIKDSVIYWGGRVFGNGVRILSIAFWLWLFLFAFECWLFNQPHALEMPKQAIRDVRLVPPFSERIATISTAPPEGIGDWSGYHVFRVAVGVSIPPAAALDHFELRPSSAGDWLGISIAGWALALSWVNSVLIIFGLPSAFMALFRRSIGVRK